MKTTTSIKIRALRQILDQTQAEFAATIGVSKDAVASWEIGRNELSASFARRIALATGVDDRTLVRAELPLLTLNLPRQPYTREAYATHQKTFWGGNTEVNARRHAVRCGDALELLFKAAAVSEGGSKLGAVLGSFIQWSQEAREYFELEQGIDAELEERHGTFSQTKSYGQWRELAKTDPKRARGFGFKDDPTREDKETLTLSMVMYPVWAPGWDMRVGKK